ncbi:MAG: peroxidase family protein [Chthoniobacterales bacterium]
MNITKTICLIFCATVPASFAASPFDVPQVGSIKYPRRALTAPSSAPAVYPKEFRSIDGSGNNPIDPLRGAVSIPPLRMVKPDYGENSPTSGVRRSARDISNLIVAQSQMIPSPARASDYLWQWGQFIDHDMDLTTSTGEPMNIQVPARDPWFDPTGTGAQWIGMDRSFFTMVGGVREQMNVITAYLDASQVYGSDKARALELRTLEGTGRLKTSAGDLLPYNVNGFPNAPSNDPSFFLAGDVRANEQVGLTAMHTLFVREHNYWAAEIHKRSPALDDEGIYLRARALVGAEIQVITYRDFIPLLLGPNALPPYTGYHASVDASIANAFSTAAFRVGHTMLSPVLLRLDGQNQSIGDMSLADCFFNPTAISGSGIEPFLRGLAHQVDQEVDCFLVDGVRNFLFGPPGAGGFDLASLNIQRGRDHGLPPYNAMREQLGLARKASFAEMTSDQALRVKLATAYRTPDDVDAWVGGLAEDHVNGGLVGELFFTIMRDQFTRLRDGDRFWYQTYLPQDLVNKVERQPLSAIVKRNTPIGAELQRNVFRVPLP